MYIKRKRQAHRLLQQIDTFQVELFNAKLKLLEIQQAEANGNRKSAKRRLWAKSWLLRRPLYGQYERLLRELTAEDIAGYKNFLRMNPEMVISVVMSCSRRLHGGCTEATERIRRRRSLYGDDGSYTERLLRDSTAKKIKHV